jgi:hypothetical protein
MTAPLQMTTAEVARLFQCCLPTVRALERAGRLTAIQTPQGIRFDALQVLTVWRRGKPWQGRWPAATRGKP